MDRWWILKDFSVDAKRRRGGANLLEGMQPPQPPEFDDSGIDQVCRWQSYIWSSSGGANRLAEIVVDA